MLHDGLPSFLQLVFDPSQPGFVNRNILAEKWKYLREESSQIEGWSKESLYLFQKKYSHRNRYINRLPYERSRVKLDPTQNIEHIDYINASFLSPGDLPGLSYIASQAPLPRTISDFWQMVSEQNIQVIVMLVVADGLKCDRYWPESEGTVTFSNGIQIRCTNHSRPSESLIIRKFLVSDSHGERPLIHYNFVAWPDHSVPDSPRALIELFETLKQDHFYKSPILVHCSAGVGRTGTFCVIDVIMRLFGESPQFSFETKDDPVVSTTLSFRDQRISIVETFVQNLEYLYIVCFQ